MNQRIVRQNLPMGGFTGMRYATFADLTEPRWRDGFRDLDEFSHAYLSAAFGSGGWPSEYPWPVDALHTNTRLWEYPFVWDAVRQRLEPGARILDIGSALTFMPSFLASKGYSVVASDVELRMETWARRLWSALRETDIWRQIAEENLDYVVADVTRLELPADSFDAVTNISVLEHLPPDMMSRAIDAIAAVLKPGGLLICTLDCWLQGEPTPEHAPLKAPALEGYMTTVQRRFSPVESPALVHPADLITNRRYPRDVGRAYRQRLAPSAGLRARLRSALSVLRADPPPLEWCALGMILARAEAGERNP